ncbi:MAG: MYXO-CTERM domain-containing protein, partial [Cognaticolwellia sp.]
GALCSELERVPNDTGDTGTPQDSAPEDSAPEDSSEEPGVGLVEPSGCGCGASSGSGLVGWLFGFGLLLLLRRQSNDGAPEGTPFL